MAKNIANILFYDKLIIKCKNYEGKVFITVYVSQINKYIKLDSIYIYKRAYGTIVQDSERLHMEESLLDYDPSKIIIWLIISSKFICNLINLGF